ncbi:MAG: choline-sulfatase [Gammaproteobacteria bacterium]|nr:choline-sulfatase [Gammaproteobacteria bacterium]
MKPNILFIQVDQMAASALKIYGNTACQTPHIDRLAAGGVVFENAYCNYPLCAPSRFSMASGLLPSRIGAYDNGAEFPASVPTYAHYLRAAGYQTILSGKMHFVGPDQLHGFEERLTSDLYPSDFQWAANWKESMHQDVTDSRMVDFAGVCIRNSQIEYDIRVGFEAERRLLGLAKTQNHAPERPFFLQVSFTHPHDPFMCQKKYWDLYDGVHIPLPTVRPRDIGEIDPHSKNLLIQSGMLHRVVSDEELIRIRRAYYGAISFVDEQIGRLLSVLEDTGLGKDTVVVLTSDHGEMLGERGMWLKKNFFEPALRVPFLIHGPMFWKARGVAEAISLVDLLPTLIGISNLDVHAQNRARIRPQNEPQNKSQNKTQNKHRDEAENQKIETGGTVDATTSIEPVETLDGVNLLPLINGIQPEKDALVYAEITCEGTPFPMFMIRQGRYKYIHSDQYPPQLYDLIADPNELVNLCGREGCQQVEDELRNQVLAKWDVEFIATDVANSQGRRRIINAALSRGKFKSWDYQPMVRDEEWFRGQTSYNEWAYSPLYGRNDDSPGG